MIKLYISTFETKNKNENSYRKNNSQKLDHIFYQVGSKPINTLFEMVEQISDNLLIYKSEKKLQKSLSVCIGKDLGEQLLYRELTNENIFFVSFPQFNILS